MVKIPWFITLPKILGGIRDNEASGKEVRDRTTELNGLLFSTFRIRSQLFTRLIHSSEMSTIFKQTVRFQVEWNLSNILSNKNNRFSESMERYNKFRGMTPVAHVQSAHLRPCAFHSILREHHISRPLRIEILDVDGRKKFLQASGGMVMRELLGPWNEPPPYGPSGGEPLAGCSQRPEVLRCPMNPHQGYDRGG